LTSALRACDFCTEGQSGRVSDDYAASIGRSSRVLLRLPALYVIPTLSPLAPNHLLLIPNRHVTSRAQLLRAEFAAITQAEDIIGIRLSAPGIRTLVFEHGIGQGLDGGCGISHLHTHMLPLAPDVADRAIDLLRLSALGITKRGLHEIQPGESYVFMRTHGQAQNSELRAGEFPSQYLRNLVEDAAGIDRTSWRDLVRPQFLQETLRSPQWA
jgi:diadenosine tetraphosphate (Ap4A) HIT family hydrolase